jgi:tetratricopeptide (TPR) repeat protein
MSEDEATSARSETPSPGPDGAAWSVLGAASREKADALVDEQRELTQEQKILVRLQAKELAHELNLRRWSHRVHHVSDVLKVTFELAVAAIAVAVVVAMAAAVWSAAHDDALVIEAFDVPADLTAKGLSGQVIATQVQDRIAFVQSHADTIRAASTFRNDWGNDIKVQIPDTGVSVGEAYRFLSSWLGHQTRVTGEVWHDGSGIAVSARAGNGEAKVFRGPESNLDRLVAAAAEYVYGQNQSYRYIMFLEQHDRAAEAAAATRSLALYGPAEERAWAYSRFGTLLDSQGEFRRALAMQQMADRFDPDLAHVHVNMAGDGSFLGHNEDTLRETMRSLSLLRNGGSAHYAPNAVAIDIVEESVALDESLGDFRAAALRAPQVQSQEDYSEAHLAMPLEASHDLALDHDIAGSEAADPEYPNEDRAAFGIRLEDLWGSPPLPEVMRAIALDRWQAARDALIAIEGYPNLRQTGNWALLPVATRPWLAYADARLGNFSDANAIIAKTPGDCYLCERMRGNIDAARKKWDAAAWWFDDAVRQAPSIPFAYADWGAMLLAKGDYDGAIAKFRLANLKGPHFADPLEMWGETLIAKNRSDLALAKFEEANKYAPNWGRLHLKWGEALLWSGDRIGAQKQFAIASGLDLAPSEGSELTRMQVADD